MKLSHFVTSEDLPTKNDTKEIYKIIQIYIGIIIPNSAELTIHNSNIFHSWITNNITCTNHSKLHIYIMTTRGQAIFISFAQIYTAINI